MTGDVHYLCWLLDPNRTILTVLNCATLSRLTGFRRAIYKYLWFTRPLNRCRWVTVISDFTKRELIATTGIPATKVLVIYPHVSAEFTWAPPAIPAPRVRVLQVGSSSNKNIERLAMALTGLNVELIVIGALSDSQRAAILDAKLSVVERVGISREDLVRAYVESDPVAFVATYEGFGLPIIEAQAVGRPVVTSDCCSMPEFAADAACIVDPFDIASIRAGLERVISDHAYRTHLIDRGLENAGRFRLAHIAAQYAELYRRVAREFFSNGDGK